MLGCIRANGSWRALENVKAEQAHSPWQQKSLTTILQQQYTHYNEGEAALPNKQKHRARSESSFMVPTARPPFTYMLYTVHAYRGDMFTLGKGDPFRVTGKVTCSRLGKVTHSELLER